MTDVRDRVVRRVPTDKDLQHRAALVLTARDRKILRAIGRHGYLTTDLIELAFFPTSRSGGRASTAAYDRLRQLWLWGYIERVDIPLARVGGGRPPFLYALGARGVRVADPEVKPSDYRARLRRQNDTSELVVARGLIVSALWANLLALARTTPVRLRRWEPADVLRARRERVQNCNPDRGLPFLPDAVFQLVDRQKRVRYGLVEVDLGTVPLPTIERKIRAFEVYLAEGRFTQSWRGETFDVYILAGAEKRLADLRRTARKVVAESRWSQYHSATTDILDPSRFAKADWLGLDDTWHPFLNDCGVQPEGS